MSCGGEGASLGVRRPGFPPSSVTAHCVLLGGLSSLIGSLFPYLRNEGVEEMMSRVYVGSGVP